MTLASAADGRVAALTSRSDEAMNEMPGLRLAEKVLYVSGQLDSSAVLQVRQEGERLIAANGADLVVDLGQVSGAHSAALSLLLCWRRYAESRGHSLQFRNVGEQLLSLAALSGLHRYLPGFAVGSHH